MSYDAHPCTQGQSACTPVAEFFSKSTLRTNDYIHAEVPSVSFILSSESRCKTQVPSASSCNGGPFSTVFTESATRNQLQSKHSKTSILAGSKVHSQNSCSGIRFHNSHSELVPQSYTDESLRRSPLLFEEPQQTCICSPRANCRALTSFHGTPAAEAQKTSSAKRVDSSGHQCVFPYMLQEITHQPEAMGRMLVQAHTSSVRKENKPDNAVSFLDSHEIFGSVHDAKGFCYIRNSCDSWNSSIYSSHCMGERSRALNPNSEGQNGLFSEPGGSDERHSEQETTCLFDLKAMFERNIFVIDHLIYSEYGSQICGAPTQKTALACRRRVTNSSCHLHGECVPVTKMNSCNGVLDSSGSLLVLVPTTSQSSKQNQHGHHVFHGRVLDGFTIVPLKRSDLRGRATAWSMEDHIRFLLGFEKYGRRWRRISIEMGTKTAAQVQSHAQKFIERQKKHPEEKKKRTIHDYTLESREVQSIKTSILLANSRRHALQ